MSAVLDTRSPPRSLGQVLGEWGPILVGLMALYVPTIIAFGRTIWQSEEQAHGPIIIAVVAWLVWDKRHVLLAAPERLAPVSGWGLILVGLLAYVLGRSQTIPLLDIGSLIPIAAGAVLALRGRTALKDLWFPFLFAVFAIPLPGLLVNAATGPLKQSVSVIAETVLYALGYPIARTGVILSVGQYQLLVADACSGLNSIFSLSALGLLYLYLMRYRSVAHNALLIASILPIAFFANVVRVMILVLVTYHFGDETGQGFAHGFAGMVLFVIALVLLFAFDSILRFVFFRKQGTDR